MKNRVIAFLLSIFLGPFGVHKFYLGERDNGILYALFSWTFIPRVLSIIDAYKLFKMSKTEFDAIYNNKSMPEDTVNKRTSFFNFRPDKWFSSASSKKVQNGVADELQKLALLMEKDLLTFEEFERRKALLLKS